MRCKSLPTSKISSRASMVSTFTRKAIARQPMQRRAAQNRTVSAKVHVQVESATPKLTREQKPYCELSLADACDRMTLRVWSDHPAYKACSSLTNESFIELAGEFNSHSHYGLEAQKWTVRPLTPQEKSELLQGPAELRAKQNADWQFMLEAIA